MNFLDIQHPKPLKQHLRELSQHTPKADSPEAATVLSPSSHASYTFAALQRLDHHLGTQHRRLRAALSQHLAEFSNFIGVISDSDRLHADALKKVHP